MTNLPSRVRDAAETLTSRSHDLSGGRPPARIARATREGVAVEQGRAQMQAARVRAVEYVSYTALRAVDELTEQEALAVQRNPLAEPRAKAIVDTATAACAHIVAETGQS